MDRKKTLHNKFVMKMLYVMAGNKLHSPAAVLLCSNKFRYPNAQTFRDSNLTTNYKGKGSPRSDTAFGV